MKAFLFAVWIWSMWNPHKQEPYMVPIQYSMSAFEQAELYPDVSPADIVAIIVAEHGGGYPYPTDSIGKASEVGLLQLTGFEVKPYNKAHGTDWTVADMKDPMLSIKVGAWAIQGIKDRHRTKRRCTSKIKEHQVITDSNGALVPIVVTRNRFHNWHAHWRCAVAVRDALDSNGKPICKTNYRVRLVKRFTW